MKFVLNITSYEVKESEENVNINRVRVLSRSSHRVRGVYWKSGNDTGSHGECLGEEISSRNYWGQESRPGRDHHGWIFLQ